jgi:hypothetical protein
MHCLLPHHYTRPLLFRVSLALFGKSYHTAMPQQTTHHATRRRSLQLIHSDVCSPMRSNIIWWWYHSLMRPSIADILLSTLYARRTTHLIVFSDNRKRWVNCNRRKTYYVLLLLYTDDGGEYIRYESWLTDYLIHYHSRKLFIDRPSFPHTPGHMVLQTVRWCCRESKMWEAGQVWNIFIRMEINIQLLVYNI